MPILGFRTSKGKAVFYLYLIASLSVCLSVRMSVTLFLKNGWRFEVKYHLCDPLVKTNFHVNAIRRYSHFVVYFDRFRYFQGNLNSECTYTQFINSRFIYSYIWSQISYHPLLWCSDFLFFNSYFFRFFSEWEWFSRYIIKEGLAKLVQLFSRFALSDYIQQFIFYIIVHLWKKQFFVISNLPVIPRWFSYLFNLFNVLVKIKHS